MRNIFPIIFIILAITGGVLFVGPMFSDVSKLRTDVTAYNTALAHSTELQKVRDTLLESYNAIPKEDKERLIKFMPNTVDNIQLILEIQQVASLHGMSLKNIAFEAPKPTTTDQNVDPGSDPNANKPYGVFNLEFKTEASYPVFLSFLKDLELNLRLIDIKSISFVVPEKKATLQNPDTDPSVYTYDVKLQTYWLKH